MVLKILIKAGSVLSRLTDFKMLRKVVIKVGTRLLTYETGKLNLGIIERLVREIADLKNRGKEIILVSSGAIGAGIGRLGLTAKPAAIEERQALAAIGQGLLIQFYEKLFAEYGHIVAQVLLTREDIENRQRYINSRNALLHLLRYGTIPIINENDTVSTEEIEFGDNDKLSALVATIVGADLLIILTNIDGLCSEDPRINPAAKCIPLVTEITPEIRNMAGGTDEMLAKGGMASKIEAAEMVMNSGIDMVIADGRQENILRRIIEGEEIGTLFYSRQGHLRSRKRWIAFTQKIKGTIYVDQGAATAITDEGKSLLPIGITSIEGDFLKGETVSIASQSGLELARGLVNYNAEELRQIMGYKSTEVTIVLGYPGNEEVIHRDNLVLC